MVVPREKMAPEECVLVSVTPVQLSVAVIADHVAVAWQELFAERIMSDDGHPAITGLVLSITITLKVHIDVFPAASFAVYFTCVVPNEKRLPDAWVVVSTGTPQLSVAVGGVQFTVALHAPFAGIVILDGQFAITGIVLS